MSVCVGGRERSEQFAHKQSGDPGNRPTPA
jgi:hypothetical protein